MEDLPVETPAPGAGIAPPAAPSAPGVPAPGAEPAAAPVAPGQVHVELAPDELEAQVTLVPAGDGSLPPLDQALAALAAAGVAMGIDEPALRLACAGAGAPVRLTAARGVAPEPGADVCFEVLVQDHRDRSPKADAHGHIDFRDFGEVPIVAAGVALMRRVPPRPGKVGWTVRGQPIAAPAGRDEPFASPLQGAALDPQDPDLLRSTLRGQSVRSGNAVLVEPVFRVKAVDLASGHVDFDGTVQVDGDVMPGMKVHAGGDIVVGGTVEGAELVARGDIRVAGGAIARARLQAGGSVTARFVECATVRAAQSIAVENTALHSELSAGVQVQVGGPANPRSRLAGGRTQAAMRISAPHLGAPSAGCTRLAVGIAPELVQRQAELRARLDEQQAQAAKLKQLCEALERQGDPKGLLARVQPAWQQAERAWGDSLRERRELDARIAALRTATIDAGIGIDGELELTLTQKTCHPRDGLGPGVFTLQAEQGVVVHTDPHGIAVPVG